MCIDAGFCGPSSRLLARMSVIPPILLMISRMRMRTSKATTVRAMKHPTDGAIIGRGGNDSPLYDGITAGAARTVGVSGWTRNRLGP